MFGFDEVIFCQSSDVSYEWRKCSCGVIQRRSCNQHRPCAVCGIVIRYRSSGHQTQRWLPSLRETMRDSIQIRPAQPVDAEVAAVLLYSAYTHTHVTYPPPEEHESGFIERLQHFFL